MKNRLWQLVMGEVFALIGILCIPAGLTAIVAEGAPWVYLWLVIPSALGCWWIVRDIKRAVEE